MWRKVLQICKSLIGAALVLCGGLLFAQSMEMPSMPTISMPEISSVSSPTMDGKFYRPTLPSQTKKSGTTSDTSTTETKSTEAIITDGTTTDDILISLLSNANLLSASDISDLYDTGSFDTLSSLTGLTGLTGSTSSASNLSTNILLRQILEKLNELKVEQNAASAAQQEVYSAQIQDSQNFKTRNPSILRFKVNNYNIKDSVTQSFFSEPEPDGSFLLTADRRYFVNNKSATETFYMLFKAIKSNGSTTTFSVTPSIAQGTENKQSYVYRLCQCKDIIAEKTGNLVVVHFVSEDLSADLLLDIDK